MIYLNSLLLNVLVGDNKCINLKLFKNGKVQMTDLPNIDIGYYCVQLIIDYLKIMMIIQPKNLYLT